MAVTKTRAGANWRPLEKAIPGDEDPYRLFELFFRLLFTTS
jgi:hypothetical protein